MKYTPEILQKIYDLKASGEYSDKEIWEIVGIHRDTWYEWKKEKPEFSELLKRADDEFFHNNMKQATKNGLKVLLEGKTWNETTKEYTYDKEGKRVLKSEKTVEKFILPDKTAVIFSSKNLLSDYFKDSQDVNVHTSGELFLSLIQDATTDEEDGAGN